MGVRYTFPMDTATSTPTSVSPDTSSASTASSFVPPIVPVQTVKSSKKNASFGSILSVVLIVAIIIIGALYAWGARLAKDGTAEPVLTQ